MRALLSFWLVGLSLCLTTVPARSDTLRVTNNLTLEYQVPGSWQALVEPPEFLVRQTVEHVTFHLSAEGKPVPPNLEELVHQRMSSNEIFLVNLQTRAHLDIDFSPIETSESPPPRETVAQSARYAEQELRNEEDLSEVESHFSEFVLRGAEVAYRIDASFKRDGEARRFVGVVGYAARHWLFFYFTDEASQEADLQALEKVLAGLVLVTN